MSRFCYFNDSQVLPSAEANFRGAGVGPEAHKAVERQPRSEGRRAHCLVQRDPRLRHPHPPGRLENVHCPIPGRRRPHGKEPPLHHRPLRQDDRRRGPRGSKADRWRGCLRQRPCSRPSRQAARQRVVDCDLGGDARRTVVRCPDSLRCPRNHGRGARLSGACHRSSLGSCSSRASRRNSRRGQIRGPKRRKLRHHDRSPRPRAGPNTRLQRQGNRQSKDRRVESRVVGWKVSWKRHTLTPPALPNLDAQAVDCSIHRGLRATLEGACQAGG